MEITLKSPKKEIIKLKDTIKQVKMEKDKFIIKSKYGEIILKLNEMRKAFGKLL